MARRALGPAAFAVAQAVRQALTADDRRLMVACSGGPDSLALAAGAVEAGRRASLPYAAVVVDHGLQPDSAAVAVRAAATLATLGYADVRVERVSVSTAGRSPEDAARSARYAALDRLAAETGATVLLGHTLDDQAETVLLGLARGSGIRSLAGMAPRRGPYLRPLLGVRRAVCVAACAEAGLDPWLNPHNDDPAYARVRVRRRALPALESELGPGVTEALARTAELARADADLLDAAGAALAGDTHDRLDCAWLADLPDAIRRRILRRWLRAQGAAEPTAGHVRAVDRLVTDWHGQDAIGVSGLSVTRTAGLLVARGRPGP